MKRSGFTMVELIFVIVIIGILSAVALPKFGGIRDKAKVNSEISAMGSFDSAITAAKEFQMDDFNNGEVNWYDLDASSAGATGDTAINTALRSANSAKSVLGGIGKKVDSLKAVGYAGLDADGNASATAGELYYSLVLITSTASDSTNGVKQPADVEENDIPGKPDRNDFWVFNPSAVDINITSVTGGKIIESGTIGLIDTTWSAPKTIGDIKFKSASDNYTAEGSFKEVTEVTGTGGETTTVPVGGETTTVPVG